jgi:hypothetical protein
LELDVAPFLDSCPDMSSFARNDLAISFKLDDAKANGDLSNFYPLRQGVEADLLIRRHHAEAAP